MATSRKLPPITKRQRDILTFLYKFRFLNRIQIQALMRHKDKRLINAWLKDLREKQYVETKYDRTFPHNTKPAIYFCSLSAIAYFKTLDDTEVVNRRLYRDNARSNEFVSGCVLIGDMAIELRQGRSLDTMYQLATASDYADPISRAHFLTESDVAPDAIIVKDEHGEFSSYLIQLFPRNYPPHLQYAKVQNYIDFYFSHDWEAKVALDFPLILFVLTSQAQLTKLKRFTYNLLDLEDEDEIEAFEVDFLLASQVKRDGIIKYL